MSRYFEQFPLMLYDIKANGYYKLVPDIFRRIKTRDKIKNNIALLDVYQNYFINIYVYDIYTNFILSWKYIFTFYT